MSFHLILFSVLSDFSLSSLSCFSVWFLLSALFCCLILRSFAVLLHCLHFLFHCITSQSMAAMVAPSPWKFTFRTLSCLVSVTCLPLQSKVSRLYIHLFILGCKTGFSQGGALDSWLYEASVQLVIFNVRGQGNKEKTEKQGHPCPLSLHSCLSVGSAQDWRSIRQKHTEGRGTFIPYTSHLYLLDHKQVASPKALSICAGWLSLGFRLPLSTGQEIPKTKWGLRQVQSTLW